MFKKSFTYLVLFLLFYFEPEQIGPITISQLWKIPLFLFLFWHVVFRGVRARPFFVKWSYARAIKTLFNNGRIFYVNHGRTGIRLALSALELPEGSRVGVQVFNCHTVFNAIKTAGYNPVFIDITDQFQIDIDDLKKKSNKIDALIITHLFGIPADIDKVYDILSDIPVIEDCAHSFLSKYHKKYFKNP